MFCILVSKLFEATLIAIPDELNTAELEAVDVLLNDVKQRFVCCYNPNEITNETTIQYVINLCKCIEFVYQVDFTITMCGDCNFSKTNFRQASIDLNTTCQIFCDCIINLGLNQLIKEPTHGKNILDLLFTNNSVSIASSQVSVPFSTSDHNSIHFSTWTPLCETQNKPVTRIFRKANFNALQTEFQRVAWDDMLTDNVFADEMWIRVKNILSNALEKYMPISKQNTKNNRYPNLHCRSFI